MSEEKPFNHNNNKNAHIARARKKSFGFFMGAWFRTKILVKHQSTMRKIKCVVSVRN